MTRADATSPQRLLALLPAALRAGAAAPGPMAGLIDAMSALLARPAQGLDAAPALFDPETAPEAALPWLAGWLGHGHLFLDPEDPRRALSLEEGFPCGAARLRRFLAAWPDIAAHRGAPEGLRLALLAATGAEVAVHEDAARLHLDVTAPAALAPLAPFLRRLIAAERPAHMTWSLGFSEAGG